MLSFNIDNAGKTIQLACDELGVATLLTALEKVRNSGGHLHLCAPSSGGHELSEQTPWGSKAIGEVIITWAGE
jgi:hypothetical protein